MSNFILTINTNRLIVFFIAILFLFVLNIAFLVFEFVRTKMFMEKVLSFERLSKEIIDVEMLFSQEKKALEQYPTLYNYVSGIDRLFTDYLLDFHKARIIRYDRPKEEMNKFKTEYRRASTHIKALVLRYAKLLKSIYRIKHPIRFILDSFHIHVKVSFTLFLLLIQVIVNSGIRLLSSFTFSQQKKQFEYERTLVSITENSEIKIAESREVNCVA